MLRTVGVAMARHRLIVLICWVVFLAACAATALGGVTGESLFDRLSSAGPTVDGEASHAAHLINTSQNANTESLSLLLHGVDPSSPGLNAVLSEASHDLAAIPGVTAVVDPLAVPPLADGQPAPVAAPLLSPDGTGLLFTVSMETTNGTLSDSLLTQVESRLDVAAGDIRRQSPDAMVEVGGNPLVVKSLVAVAQNDLEKGELISLPIALLVMLIIFGGFLAAAMPLIGAGASILGALGSLFAFTYLLDINITVMNVITVIGLGLSIDYGLLIVSRFREEFRARVTELNPVIKQTAFERHELMLQSVGTTVNTAGRTVLFSGLTFALATLGLLVFEPAIIKAIAIGAVSVVVIAILTALVLVPALLGYFGERLLKPGLLTRIPGLGTLLSRFGDVAPAEGFFSKLTRGIQHAPLLVALGSLVVLLLLGSPVLSLTVSNSGDEAIPASSSQAAFLTALGDNFPYAVAPRIELVSQTDEPAAAAWAAQVGALPHVTGTTAPVAANGYWVSQVTAQTHQGASVVREIRADRPDFPNWVGGTDAASVDYIDSLVQGAPWAAMVIALATFVLLFLMTGSVVIPLTALLISVLSLGASIGVLVWGFQEGNLAGPLNFDPAAVSGVDALVLVLVLVFGFGLAMDYEMFLLARIKEHHDRGEPTRLAIETGLQSSGRIITSAALIIVLVFAGFATGELMQMKQIGVALAVAVLLDATLVRSVLVPAVMTSLETVLWWAPRWMKRVQQRVGLHE
ncbi:MMPL family transporter [Glaciibacter psychrotolerans]|uniref:RND superfamily putative drug exporter n=1 Tax=Glaciibacter psychrotolerans TaxID=670054 RepID=A0A7Z0EDL3_9MICO|nr:MMPL family transporter [Leifsonia psychrotolerans]NYJ19064.1 RND superfamily putative drug exporter [Leifsonia psychrotolerans]